jgi:pimeloyl-ACP methyl ester carboxylesterase
VRRRWLRASLLLCAAVVLLWLVDSWRTRNVQHTTLESSPSVTVSDDGIVLAFLPAQAPRRTGLIFLCGSMAPADAYAMLLRPVADAGYPVFIVNLPYQLAPLETHRPVVVERVRKLMAARPEVSRWVVSGHSLGAALAARFAGAGEDPVSGLLLIGTTHPQAEDLSQLSIPVTKIYATHDGMAATRKVLANKAKLPAHTQWVEIAGGNHAQFGRYIEPIADGKASISHEQQEALTRSAIIRLLDEVDKAAP